jgi:hypothetical protein
VRPGSLDDLDGLAYDLAQAAGDVGSDWRLRRGGADSIDLSIFEDEDGAVRALALGNPSAAALRAHLHGPAGTTLRELASGKRLRAERGSIVVDLAALAVRLFAVEPVRP